MARQVPVGWEVAAGRRSFSAVSFRIRCLCRVLWQLRRGFLRNLLRFTGKDFRLPHHYIFQPPPIISIRRLFLCLKPIRSRCAHARALAQKRQNPCCIRCPRRHQRGVGQTHYPDAGCLNALLVEAVPIFLAGMFFGPIPGALVGFSADLVGCLFSGYGYNPCSASRRSSMACRQASSARC